MTFDDRAFYHRVRVSRAAIARARARRRLAPILLCTAGLFAAAPAAAQEAHRHDPVRVEVLAAAQTLFDAMAARDSAAVADILLPEGGFYAVRMEEGEPVRAYIAHAEFAGMVSQQPESPIERMWDAQVLVHDPIAMVWTPYDFYFGETFSHCGVDAFSLVRTAEGWKIAGIVFTRETEGCPESPAGPAGGS